MPPPAGDGALPPCTGVADAPDDVDDDGTEAEGVDEGEDDGDGRPEGAADAEDEAEDEAEADGPPVAQVSSWMTTRGSTSSSTWSPALM